MDSPHRHFLEPNVVPHPGETVLEYLEFNGWSQRDLARRTGLTPKTISDICNGKGPITPPTALAFEKALQRPAHLWLNLQLCFDEAKARGHQTAKSAEWNDWLRKFPLEDMRRMRFSLAERGSDVDISSTFSGYLRQKAGVPFGMRPAWHTGRRGLPRLTGSRWRHGSGKPRLWRQDCRSPSSTRGDWFRRLVSSDSLLGLAQMGSWILSRRFVRRLESLWYWCPRYRGRVLVGVLGG